MQDEFKFVAYLIYRWRERLNNYLVKMYQNSLNRANIAKMSYQGQRVQFIYFYRLQ